MKLRTLFVALVTALFAASVALAHDGPPAGKGKPEGTPSAAGHKAKPPRTGPNCRPRVKVVLKGTLADDPAAGATSLLLTVKKANRHGRAYQAATQPVQIMLDENTKIRRGKDRSVESLALGDRAHIQAKVCKDDLKDGGMPQLTAKHVNAKAPKPAPAAAS